MSARTIRLDGSERLDPTQVTQVLALARAAGDADGADPLDEQLLLRLRDDRTPATHLLAWAEDGTLVGYANLDTDDPAADAGVALVVHPAYRRQGTGRALAQELLARPTPGREVSAFAAGATPQAVPSRPVRAWAHGDHPSAAALAVGLGFRRARVLWQLRRPLTAPLSEPRLPNGVTLRTFVPGVDDEAWLALNARAFADHPEQGRWTIDDLRVRLAEPWFDAAGFLLAEESATGRLLGFHWTKVHERPGSASIGEVYVLGVEPSAHGGGLGRALTTAGLAYLREQRGLDRVMLYVDESNTGAVALYQRLGFARWSAHVHYQRD
ncbi:mycothiol synthase [Micromonospora endophytica]|uniref:Mycothiol acetyltransferase n=1 Tax=Micromonospora endophytica TaxID=515350 RepID=A0A2W2C073_9ACTN|nr:mycothiol synthase [Micromonospora endophytica]PZF92851.1 mycothiol synthase [Micromonospora endophytica]RIW48760.1 mycothiol synthase [Micromonospora endophytica]BCJ59976.1 mycothiol acetyltransferase [Micromonospora endophytica]